MTRKQKNIILVIVLLLLAAWYRMPSSTPAPAGDGSKPTTEQTQLTEARGQGTATVSRANSVEEPATATPQRSRILAEQGNYREYRYYLQETPNDPYQDDNWAQDKVQTERAWDMTTGDSSTVVAVIDSGFALDHEDLTGRWRTNAAEQGMTSLDGLCWTGTPADKTSNDCDDDDNGYIDDWRGYDFYHDDNDAQAGLTNPSGEAVDHGTMVAGTIGATANNSLGGAGMNWAAQIMPLQIFSDDGEAYTSHVVEAIEYAVDNGAQIVNLSLGTNAVDGALLAAVQYAAANDVLVVAASGNCIGSSDSFCTVLPDAGRMLYPANFSETLSVGATTSTDTRASFSSYGSELDMVAPGVATGPVPWYTSDEPTSAYATASGTSFAAPMTSGVAALALAENPTLTRNDLFTILTESAQKVSAMGSSYTTNELGQGRLNAYRALLLARALGDTDQLGTESIDVRQPPLGGFWRSQSGDVASDEWILVGCRVASAQTCTATAAGATTVRYETALKGKAGELQYIYIPGSSLPAGSSLISVHSTEYAYPITTLTR
jgi:serine protease